jgi:phospholipase/carboxylesterase
MTPSSPILREEGVYDRRLGLGEDRKASIFVPQKLEDRYSYPLVVFLHGHGADERQWLSQMIHLSRRNYVGVALRGPHRVAGHSGRLGYGWGRDRRSASSIEDYIHTAVDDVRGQLNIDGRKIHIAGFDEGASLAIQLGLSMGGVFSKVVAINGGAPASPLPLGFGPQRLRGLQRPRILLGYGPKSADDDGADTKQTYRLLHSAGLTVELRRYSNGSRLSPAMLRDADRWLMDWWTW